MFMFGFWHVLAEPASAKTLGRSFSKLSQRGRSMRAKAHCRSWANRSSPSNLFCSGNVFQRTTSPSIDMEEAKGASRVCLALAGVLCRLLFERWGEVS